MAGKESTADLIDRALALEDESIRLKKEIEENEQELANLVEEQARKEVIEISHVDDVQSVAIFLRMKPNWTGRIRITDENCDFRAELQHLLVTLNKQDDVKIEPDI